MDVGDEEGDVVALNGLSSQNAEVLSSHHHEPHELVTQDPLYIIRLEGEG